VGFAGYWAAGWLADRFGRRPAATLYLLGAAAATALCFQSRGEAWIYGAYFALVGLGGLWTLAATLTTELFPTPLRATAMGLTNHGVGRIGLVLGPWAAGALAERLGSTGDAVTALAAVNLLCIPLLWTLLPETRGTNLERVGTPSPRAAAD
jgi:putative MFS transporter